MKILSHGTKGTTPPVSLELAKANSNIEHEENNALLGLLLSASVSEAENYTGMDLMGTTGIKLGVNGWYEEIMLPHYPVSAITSISYKAANGDDTTLPTENYELVHEDLNSTIVFNLETFPCTKAGLALPITITYSTGYTTCPADIQKGILLIFSHNELYREDMPLKFNRSSRTVLRPYRRNR